MFTLINEIRKPLDFTPQHPVSICDMAMSDLFFLSFLISSFEDFFDTIVELRVTVKRQLFL